MIFGAMGIEKGKLPVRKHPRLRDYDYSSDGAYFVTICTKDRKCILSKITAGSIEYSEYGRIAEKQLLSLEERYPFVKLDKYVIMPDHIHMMLILSGNAAGASPAEDRRK